MRDSRYFKYRMGFFLRPMVHTLGVGGGGQKSNFAEHGHVAFVIEESKEYNNSKPKLLPQGQNWEGQGWVSKWDLDYSITSAI